MQIWPPVLAVSHGNISDKETIVKANVKAAVEKSSSGEFGIPTAQLALKQAIDIIKIIKADMPWWKKVIFSVELLVRGIEDYLRDEGWDL